MLPIFLKAQLRGCTNEARKAMIRGHSRHWAQDDHAARAVSMHFIRRAIGSVTVMPLLRNRGC